MLNLTPDQTSRAVNLFLRLSSLGSKFILVLYMGRFFELSEIGIYGLVFSAVIFMVASMGQELGYVVKREIVGIPRVDALRKMRDQAIWYGVNYVLAALVVAVFILTGNLDIPFKYLLFAFVIGVFESLGTSIYNNMNLLGQQVWANLAFFLRAGAWMPVVLVLGFISKDYRTADVVLSCWAVGSLLAFGIPLWSWRNWGWRELAQMPIDWAWIFKGIKISAFIWAGTVGLMCGAFINRYFVNHYLGLELVGVMTFYYSFIFAIEPLVESGTLIFSAPKLVALHKEKKSVSFRREAMRAFWQVGIAAAVLCLLLSVFVPVLAYFLDKIEIVQEMETFWLLLVAAWIGAINLVFYYLLFAQHRDKIIWMGNMLFLIPALAGNYFLIPLLGFQGVGYSVIIAEICLFLWRLKFVRWPRGRA